MILGEEGRLRRVFRAILLVSVGGPLAAQGCGRAGAGRASPADDDAGGTDASTSDDVAVSVDAGPDPCAPKDYVPQPDSGLDASDKCAALIRFECGVPAGIKPGQNCYFQLNDCSALCTDLFFNCHAFDDSCIDGSIPEGGVTIDCVTCPGAVGRRPSGLEPACFDRAPALGDFLARAAHLEAASVHAFRALACELRALGAPRALVYAAARAMRDEARHARVTARLARRHGARAPGVRVRPSAPRALEALALDNAVEGCVRETYGALFAEWQAGHARDPKIASAMTAIAADETRHAALAWAIARWAEARLDEAANARVAARRAEAIHALACEALEDPAPEVAFAAGAPKAEQKRALVEALARTLWAA
jgi:hypothetical protein